MHYGVKGMEWGKHKFGREKNVTGTAKNAEKRGDGLGTGPVGSGLAPKSGKQLEVPTDDKLGIEALAKKKAYEDAADELRKEIYGLANAARDLDAATEYNQRHPNENGTYTRYDTDKLKAKIDVLTQKLADMDATTSAYDAAYQKSLIGKGQKVLDELTGKRKKLELKHDDLTDDELMHYGILGMKWGVRRFQNTDGSLTEAGKRRYKTGDGSRSAGQSRSEERKQKKEVKAAQKEYDKYIANRKKALTAEDPAEISKYSKYLTDEELQFRINRVRKERELTDLYNQQNNTKYFDSKKAVGQAAMTGFQGIGQGVQELAKNATVYLGKETIKNLLGEDVAREMFPNMKKQEKKEGGS